MNPPKLNNRSENGQFQSDAPQTGETKRRSENGQLWSGSQPSPDWPQTVEMFRRQEWALHETMIRAAAAAAESMEKHPRRVSLFQIAKVYELASILGRRAAGMPLDYSEPQKPAPAYTSLSMEEALERAYGDKKGSE